MFSVWKSPKPELPNERQEPDLIQPNSLNLKSGHLKLNPKDGLEYVWILPDTFQMGCVPDDTQCDEDEKPRHPVEITKGFWMSSTEVTVAAYKRFVAATSRQMPEAPDEFNPNWKEVTHPIANVTWNEANEDVR